MTNRKKASAVAAIAPPSTETANFYEKYGVPKDQSEELEKSAVAIANLLGTAFDSIVAIGRELNKANAILSTQGVARPTRTRKVPSKGTFMSWATERICEPLSLSYDTIMRWAQIATEVDERPDRAEKLKEFSPSALYETLKPSFPSVLKDAVLDSQGPVLSNKQITEIKKLYSAATAQQYKIAPQAIVAISRADNQVSKAAIRQIAKLEPKEQIEYADAIALDRHAGLEKLRERTLDIAKTEAPQTISVAKGGMCEVETQLDLLESESIDCIVVECPSENGWMYSDFGLSSLSHRLQEVLVPGGFAMIFLGHVSILSCGHYLGELKPHTLLTVRRMPGSSVTNVGVNTGYAAAHAVLAYKTPFKSPPKIVFDLQSYEEHEQVPNELGEVTTGIEAGIAKFFEALIEPNSNVAHLVVGNRSFGIRPTLSEKLQELKARNFYLL